MHFICICWVFLSGLSGPPPTFPCLHTSSPVPNPPKNTDIIEFFRCFFYLWPPTKQAKFMAEIYGRNRTLMTQNVKPLSLSVSFHCATNSGFSNVYSSWLESRDGKKSKERTKDGILGRKFNKRLVSLAPCHSQSLLLAYFTENHTLIWF